MTARAKVLIAGRASGAVLRLEAPISFWGGVDRRSAEIVMADHPQKGQSIADTMLVVPDLIGSSSSSAVMLELVHRGLVPRALILGRADAILPIGVLVAEQMEWGSIPMVALRDPPFRTGDRIEVGPDGVIDSL